MACSITITSVTASGPAATPTVTVSGTASECPSVVVTLTCGSFETSATVPVTSGSFTATFGNTQCPCAGAFTATATCSADPACSTTISGTVDCPACPSITTELTIGGCTTDGLRTVTLAVTVTPLPGTGTVWTQIEWAPGVFAGATSSLAYAATHEYSTGIPHDPVVHVLLPTGCAPLSVTVPPLEACVVCPTISLSSSIGDCTTDGLRMVSVAAVFTGATTPVQYRWVVDTVPGLIQSVAAGLSPPPLNPALATSMAHQIGIEIVSPAGCAPAEIMIGPLAPCGPITPLPPGDETGTPVDPEGGADDDESVGCLVSRWAIAALFGIGALFMLAWLCPSLTQPWFRDLALALFATGFVLMIIWIFACSPSWCEILKLAWEVAFAMMVSAIYLSGCPACRKFMLVTAAISGATFLAAYVAWETACDVDWCQRAWEWGFTLIVATGTILDILAGSLLFPCALPTVPIVTGILGTLSFVSIRFVCDSRGTRARGVRRRARCGCK